jgi:hypothetical protein
MSPKISSADSPERFRPNPLSYFCTIHDLNMLKSPVIRELTLLIEKVTELPREYAPYRAGFSTKFIDQLLRFALKNDTVFEFVDQHNRSICSRDEAIVEIPRRHWEVAKHNIAL